MATTQLFINTAEGLTDGTVPAVANTGAGGNTAISNITVGAASTIKASTFRPVHGTNGYEFDLGGNTSDGPTRLTWALARSDRAYISAYFGAMANAGSNVEDLLHMRHATATAGVVILRADDKLQMLSTSGGAIAASVSSGVYPFGSPTRLVMVRTKGTSSTTGTLGYSLYVGDSDTALYTWEATNVDCGTTDTSSCSVGRSTGRADANTLYADTITGGYGTGWPTHYVDPVGTPVAALNGNQPGLEPNTLIYLSAAGSSAPGSAIAAYHLTQTAGPTVSVTGSGPTWTYTTPAVLAGATITFSLTVENTPGTVSSAVTATHTVLSVNEGAAASGAYVPLRAQAAA